MTRILSFVFLCLLPCISLAADSDTPDLSVMIVGTSDLLKTADGVMPGATQDCEDLTSHFRNVVKIPENRLASRCGAEATHSNVLGALADVLAFTAPGDTIAIIWIGPGARMADSILFLPYDADSVNFRQTTIKPHQLVPKIVTSEEGPKTNLLVLMDTMHPNTDRNKPAKNGPLASDFGEYDGVLALSSTGADNGPEPGVFADVLTQCWDRKGPNNAWLLAQCMEMETQTASTYSTLAVGPWETSSALGGAPELNLQPVEGTSANVTGEPEARDKRSRPVRWTSLAVAGSSAATSGVTLALAWSEQRKIDQSGEHFSSRSEFDRAVARRDALGNATVGLWVVAGIGTATFAGSYAFPGDRVRATLAPNGGALIWRF